MLTPTLVPLKDLRHSSLNARKTNVDQEIAELAASIAAQGLLSSLAAVPSIDEPGRFEVVAGGRRLRALHKLLDEGAIDFDQPIAVVIEPREDGRDVSLAENTQRISMNPADEFEAYAAIVGDHAAEPDPVGYCARRQNVSRSYVEGRLRLAALAPEILDALRAGAIGIEAAKAYAAFSDQDLQRTVFAAESRRSVGPQHRPREIRDAMRIKTYPTGMPQAVYVGLDAYLAAGGRIEPDLFMGQEDGERLLDPSLLDQLARDKALPEARALAIADGFADAMLVQGFGAYPAWPNPPKGLQRDHAAAGLDPDRHAASVAVYRLRPDGSGLVREGRFVPPPAAPAPPAALVARRDAIAATIAHPQPLPAAPPQVDAERRRAADVRIHAARLALPRFDGATLATRAHWPAPTSAWVPLIDERPDGKIFVAMILEITREELDAQRAAAEQLLDAADVPPADDAGATAGDGIDVLDDAL